MCVCVCVCVCVAHQASLHCHCTSSKAQGKPTTYHTLSCWPLQVVSLPNVDQILLAWDWSAFGSADLWAAMISFLYLNFLDCTGTLFSMAVYINRMLPGFIDPNTKEFPNQVCVAHT